MRARGVMGRSVSATTLIPMEITIQQQDFRARVTKNGTGETGAIFVKNSCF
jgi:hypothetical protein